MGKERSGNSFLIHPVVLLLLINKTFLIISRAGILKIAIFLKIIPQVSGVILNRANGLSIWNTLVNKYKSENCTLSTTLSNK